MTANKLMSQHLCGESSYPATSVFGKVVSLGWYDGTTSGVAQCPASTSAFKYDLIAWDSDQERRIFAFSPMECECFDRIVSLLTGSDKPRWPFWFPRWQFAPSEEARVRNLIDSALALAGRPQFVVGGGRSLEVLVAVRQLSDAVLARLPDIFDDEPVDDFGYWAEYLGLRR